MTTPKLCIDCIHYHVPASKEPCRDCLPQTVAVPNFKSKPSGWIAWAGGECPVEDDAIVSLRFRGTSSETRKVRAGGFTWKHSWVSFDIVAYKVER